MNPKLIFHQLFEKQSSTYTYILADAESKEAIIIDSVIETVKRDLKLIHELGLKLIYVLDTHIHADHVTAAGEIRNRQNIKTAVAKKANVLCADVQLSEGDQLNFGQFHIRVLETPGHTDSSLSFVCEDMVFTGDALLIRSCGRTDFQGGSSQKLFDSVVNKLFKMKAETKVFPAHDYQGFASSTIGMEIKYNTRLGAGISKEEFIKIMTNLKLDYPKQIDKALPLNQLCGLPNSANEGVHAATVLELKAKSDHVLIIDVRNPDEFNGELGHIPSAHLITLGDDLNSFLKGYDKDEEIVFVCKSGKRSATAVKLASDLGFKKVTHLSGGMIEWNKVQFADNKVDAEKKL